jgi:hypothetical protein
MTLLMDQVIEEIFMLPVVRYRAADVDGFKVFYRKSGPADAPKLLLLHGSRARAICFVI